MEKSVPRGMVKYVEIVERPAGGRPRTPGYWVVDPPGGLHDSLEEAVAWALRTFTGDVDLLIRRCPPKPKRR